MRLGNTRLKIGRLPVGKPPKLLGCFEVAIGAFGPIPASVGPLPITDWDLKGTPGPLPGYHHGGSIVIGRWAIDTSSPPSGQTHNFVLDPANTNQPFVLATGFPCDPVFAGNNTGTYTSLIAPSGVVNLSYAMKYTGTLGGTIQRHSFPYFDYMDIAGTVILSEQPGTGAVHPISSSYQTFNYMSIAPAGTKFVSVMISSGQTGSGSQVGVKIYVGSVTCTVT